MKYVFYTLLKVHDCERRLEDVINTGIFVREGFVGWVNKRKFTVQSRDKYVRSSANRILHGKLIEVDGGTKIECIWKLPILMRFMYIAIMVIFGLYIVMAVALFINYLTGAFPSIVDKKGDIFSAFIALPFCAGFVLLGKELSKWQEEKVITMVKITLQTYKEGKK